MTEQKVIENKSIQIGTLLKYLPILAVHDTWFELSKLKVSPSSVTKIIKYGMKVGFVKIEPIIKENGRPIRRYIIVPGKYYIKVGDFEGYLVIEVKGGKLIVAAQTETPLNKTDTNK